MTLWDLLSNCEENIPIGKVKIICNVPEAKLVPESKAVPEAKPVPESKPVPKAKQVLEAKSVSKIWT